MTPSHLIAVTEWVNWVAVGTGMSSGADPAATIKTRAGMLGEKYPDTRMFTQESAAFAALECGLMALPSVGILGKLLEKWWDKHRPAQIALVAPGGADLANAAMSGEDRALAGLWLRDAGANKPEGQLAIGLSAMRGRADAGFNWLVRNNPQARYIAEQRGWISEDTAGDYTDPARILASVRNIVSPPHPQANYWLAALRAAVGRHAPELVDLVPIAIGDLGVPEPDGPRQQSPTQAAEVRADDGRVRVAPAQAASPPAPVVDDTLAAQFEARHGRKAGALTAEQLHATRMAGPPGLRAVAEAAALKAAVAEAMAAPRHAEESPALEPELEDDWRPAYLSAAE